MKKLSKINQLKVGDRFKHENKNVVCYRIEKENRFLKYEDSGDKLRLPPKMVVTMLPKEPDNTELYKLLAEELEVRYGSEDMPEVKIKPDANAAKILGDLFDGQLDATVDLIWGPELETGDLWPKPTEEDRKKLDEAVSKIRTFGTKPLTQEEQYEKFGSAASPEHQQDVKDWTNKGEAAEKVIEILRQELVEPILPLTSEEQQYIEETFKNVDTSIFNELENGASS